MHRFLCIAACGVIAATSSRAQAATVDFSGEHRTRYESLDPQFRPSLGPDDEALAFRTTVGVEVRWTDWAFAAEVMDSRATLNDGRSFVNTGIVNAVEPTELRLVRHWRSAAGRADDSLALGRMTVDLGSRRLLARNRYRNTVNTFVGIDWRRTTAGNANWRAFYLKPVGARPTSRDALLDNDVALDEPMPHSNLVGLYFAAAPVAGGRRLEAYGMAFADESSSRRKLTTLGLRIYRPARSAGLFYDVELIGQAGRSTGRVAGELRSGLEHAAGYAHAELGYRWAGRREPTVSLKLDRATGDGDPNDADYGRFDTLFGARRFDYGPTGIYGPFPRANLAARGLRFAFRPGSRTRATFVYQRFRLASAHDAWPTTGLAAPDGGAGRSLGRQLEASVAIDAIADRLRFELGAARFSPGTFVGASSPDRSGAADYVHIAATVTF